jgi:hypothetical protein
MAHRNMQTRRPIIVYALLLLLSLVALAFAWCIAWAWPGELRSLPASYKLDPAELESIERSVRSTFEWAFVPLGVIVVAWAVAARLFFSLTRAASVKDESRDT